MSGQSKSRVSVFMDQFDDEGLFQARDGAVDVEFVLKSGKVRGKLHFAKGRCVRAQVEGGSDWVNPGESPLMGVHFLLHFEGETDHGILINDGLVVEHYDKGVPKR